MTALLIIGIIVAAGVVTFKLVKSGTKDSQNDSSQGGAGNDTKTEHKYEK